MRHVGIFTDIGLDSGSTGDDYKICTAVRDIIANIIPDSDLDSQFVDIGCNCGYHLREISKRGARKLRGIEPRIGHLDFAKEWCRIDGIEAEWICKPAEAVVETDVNDCIVLALGLVYHLGNIKAFIENLVTCKYAIIESQIWASAHKGRENSGLPSHCFFDGEIERPSSAYLEEIFKAVGFKHRLYEHRIPGRGIYKIWVER